jgi:hypothetical protein
MATSARGALAHLMEASPHVLIEVMAEIVVPESDDPKEERLRAAANVIIQFIAAVLDARRPKEPEPAPPIQPELPADQRPAPNMPAGIPQAAIDRARASLGLTAKEE